MKISITLGEVTNQCNDWDLFCKEQGFSYWACAEGGEHIEVLLTKDEAHRYGLI